MLNPRAVHPAAGRSPKCSTSPAPRSKRRSTHHAFDGPGEQVELRASGDSAPTPRCIGAAEIAFAELLADPLGGRALVAR